MRAGGNDLGSGGGALSLPVLDAGRTPPARPAGDSAATQLIDAHGRVIRDVRISITDRCNFRCVYCLEPDARFMARSELLTIEEYTRIARVCVAMGVRKLRITGGEPTVHPRLLDAIAGFSALCADDVALTTNGALVTDDTARRWRDAGLNRVTISLDSLREDRFKAITRSGVTPTRVAEAVRSCQRAGLEPVKVNAVIVRGVNDDEVAALAGFAREHGVDMRLIEFMPLDDARAWDETKLVPASEMLDRVGSVYPLRPLIEGDPHSTSSNFVFADGAPGRLGVIASVTRPFCGACSRLRVTADGKVRPCLFSHDEWDLRPVLRAGATDADIAAFLADATWTKQPGHGIRSAGFTPPARNMAAIGG